jgi:hypothetical protein
MSVTITEILGTDSIAGSRLTINSNFLLLENAYNELEDSFNINVLTGSLDLSNASSGQIKSKSLISNSLVMPSSGSPTVQIYGTGASAGYGVFSNTVSSGTGSFSNNLQTKDFSATGSASFSGNVTFSSDVESNGKFQNGLTGTFVNKNRKASVSSTTAFPVSSSSPNAGLTGTYSNPYVPTLEENLLYIDSSYSDGGYNGFFMKVSDSNGASVSLIPAGFTLTLVDVAPVSMATGSIVCGITGGTSYYTGFNTNGSHGNYSSTININTTNPYKTSVTLVWEPRIGQNSATEKGSWIVVSTSGDITL